MNSTVHKKVAGGGLAGMISIIVLWVIGLVATHFGVQVPPEVAGAFTGIVSTMTAYYIGPDTVGSQQQQGVQPNA
jgi:hypothetical protein